MKYSIVVSTDPKPLYQRICLVSVVENVLAKRYDHFPFYL